MAIQLPVHWPYYLRDFVSVLEDDPSGELVDLLASDRTDEAKYRGLAVYLDRLPSPDSPTKQKALLGALFCLTVLSHRTSEMVTWALRRAWRLPKLQPWSEVIAQWMALWRGDRYFRNWMQFTRPKDYLSWSRGQDYPQEYPPELHPDEILYQLHQEVLRGVEEHHPELRGLLTNGDDRPRTLHYYELSYGWDYQTGELPVPLERLPTDFPGRAITTWDGDVPHAALELLGEPIPAEWALAHYGIDPDEAEEEEEDRPATGDPLRLVVGQIKGKRSSEFVVTFDGVTPTYLERPGARAPLVIRLSGKLGALSYLLFNHMVPGFRLPFDTREEWLSRLNDALEEVSGKLDIDPQLSLTSLSKHEFVPAPDAPLVAKLLGQAREGTLQRLER